MPLIKTHTIIKADVKTCFDLARDIDVHQESLKQSQEVAIYGKTTGLIELGETVTWEAKHFGFVQHLSSKITKFNSCNYFLAEMVSGSFETFKQAHIFRKNGDKTVMINVLYFESPYGFLGKLANVLFLKRYMAKLLEKRNSYLKIKAEKSSKSFSLN